MEKKTAVIAGATGLVGHELLQFLLQQDAYERIILLTRREIAVDDDRVKVLAVDFDALATHAKDFTPASDYYCCLGTTLTQVSKGEVIKVDYDYVVSFAKVAAGDAQCRHFLLLTSIGANASSHLLYNRTKGRVEASVRALKIPSVHIFRPSLILGRREKKRWHEEILKIISSFVSFFMVGTRRRFMAIEARRVAMAMYLATGMHEKGVHLYTPSCIYEMTEGVAGRHK